MAKTAKFYHCNRLVYCCVVTPSLFVYLFWPIKGTIDHFNFYLWAVLEGEKLKKKIFFDFMCLCFFFYWVLLVALFGQYLRLRAVLRINITNTFSVFQIRTGEEDESNVFQLNAKLFAFDHSSQSWQERGRGTLRLNDMTNKNDTSFQSRLGLS